MPEFANIPEVQDPKQKKDLLRTPVKLLLLFDSPIQASANDMIGNLGYYVDKVSWEDSYLCLETKMGLVPWLIGHLTDNPKDMILGDLQTNAILATGKEQIKDYLSALGISTELMEKDWGWRWSGDMIEVLPIDASIDQHGVTIWKAIPWKFVEKLIKSDRSKSMWDRDRLLEEISEFGNLATSNPDRFKELYEWLVQTFKGSMVTFVQPKDFEIETGISVEIPRTLLESSKRFH